MTLSKLPLGTTWGLDCHGADAKLLPGCPPVLFPYINGPDDKYWPTTTRDLWPASQQITVSTDPNDDDVMIGEEFDLTSDGWLPQHAASVVEQRAAKGTSTLLHGTFDDYQAVTKLLAFSGIRDMVRWRINWPGLTVSGAWSMLGADIYAVRFASPGIGGQTMIPGLAVTLEQCRAGLTLIGLSCLTWQE